MPKVILQVYPTLGNTDEMERLRPIGRNSDAYQNTLQSLVELAKAADDLGYWGLAHVEHHFHSEGMELSPAPLMLNIYLGHFTKRLMHGQLGLVLPAHDPLRLAEEIAIADHILKGRLFVGMARGYQTRWQNVLCQKVGVEATTSDAGEVDQRNRALFAENFKIMKMAWAQDLLQYDGPTYKIPYPYEGIPDWPPTHTITSKYGTPGEVTDDGTVKAVSVVPKPYTAPHPQLFQAFGASPPTMEWCGQENVTPTILFGSVERLKELIQIYMEAAERGGRKPRFGEGIGVCRTFHIVENGNSEDAARAKVLERAERYEAPVWRGWYETFGMLSVMLRMPEDGEGPVPAPGESIGERMLKSGVLIGGTVDSVKRQVEELLTEVPIEYLVWLFHWGMIPRDDAMQTLELFANHIIPEFGLEEPGALTGA